MKDVGRRLSGFRRWRKMTFNTTFQIGISPGFKVALLSWRSIWSSEKWRSQINNLPDLILSRSVTSISLSLVITATNLSFQLFSNFKNSYSFIFKSTWDCATKYWTVIARHFRKYEGWETLFAFSIPSNVPSRAPYLKFCARRKLGSSEIIATKHKFIYFFFKIIISRLPAVHNDNNK